MYKNVTLIQMSADDVIIVGRRLLRTYITREAYVNRVLPTPPRECLPHLHLKTPLLAIHCQHPL